jgi:hypothetical protein
MSLEKNFQRRSSEFLFVSVVLFGFLYGVSGSVFAVLACASMLFSVKFHVGMREVCMLHEAGVWMLWGLREERLGKKKAAFPFRLLLPLVWLISVSDVISSRLGLVIIPNRVCASVVVCLVCTLTTTSMLSRDRCCGLLQRKEIFGRLLIADEKRTRKAA